MTHLRTHTHTQKHFSEQHVPCEESFAHDPKKKKKPNRLTPNSLSLPSSLKKRVRFRVLEPNFELMHNFLSSSIKREAASFAYTMATIYQSTRRHNQKDWYLHKLNVFCSGMVRINIWT